jgi:hypothetical protein
MDKICDMCKNKNPDEPYVSMVHKWRPYGGYSEGVYPRYFCSKECLAFYEKEYRCNHCHIVKYDGVKYKKGKDGMVYCYDELELTIGEKPCYYLVANQLKKKKETREKS